jgi:hypothetical protein
LKLPGSAPTGSRSSAHCFPELIEGLDIRDGHDFLVREKPENLCVVPMWAGAPGHVEQYPLAEVGGNSVILGYEIEAFRVRYGA